ncbi:inactive ubiquitin carboxyl-terminal hydrolase 50 isoform X2 [Meleagris gallopavo]|uniref:inactive ubiquitin carboxyl-terminal hydrolase 50 isoform X2 n=1 Tax=Meleagris gallopavo TaxID=9103 RepID=UPI0012AC5252|nr:inactive ubiquitin carboxyl-terminal hydrolase 50 isoform X2 [Meleagris gallopavo]
MRFLSSSCAGSSRGQPPLCECSSAVPLQHVPAHGLFPLRKSMKQPCTSGLIHTTVIFLSFQTLRGCNEDTGGSHLPASHQAPTDVVWPQSGRMANLQPPVSDVWLRELNCISLEGFCSVLGEQCPTVSKRTLWDVQEFICILNKLHGALKKVDVY